MLKVLKSKIIIIIIMIINLITTNYYYLFTIYFYLFWLIWMFLIIFALILVFIPCHLFIFRHLYLLLFLLSYKSALPCFYVFNLFSYVWQQPCLLITCQRCLWQLWRNNSILNIWNRSGVFSSFMTLIN